MFEWRVRMMRQVIRDYFTAYRAGRWKAVGNGWFLLVYCLTVMPCMMQLFGRGMMRIIDFYVMAVVLLFALYAAPIHPVTLPKIMYLCPMSAAARRTYITKAYLFKVFFPIGLAVLGMGALTVLGEMNAYYGVCVVLAVAGVSVCTSLFREERITACIEKKQSAVFYSGEDGWETFAVIVASFTSLFLLFFSVWAEDFDGIMGVVVLVCMAVFELPLTIMMARRIKPALDAAVWYEGQAK